MVKDEVKVSMNIVSSLVARMRDVENEIRDLIDKEYEIKGRLGVTSYTLKLKKALINAQSVFDSFQHWFAETRLEAMNKPIDEPENKEEDETEPAEDMEE